MVVAAATPLEAIDRGASALADVVRRLLAGPERSNVHLGVGPGNLPAAALASAELPWDRVHVFQLEDVVLPDGADGRLDEALLAALGRLPIPPGRLHLLPAGAADPLAALGAHEAAIARIAGHLDVVIRAARLGALLPALAVDPALLEGAVELRLEVRRGPAPTAVRGRASEAVRAQRSSPSSARSS